MDDCKWATKMYYMLFRMHRVALVASYLALSKSALKDAIKSVVMNMKPSTRDRSVETKELKTRKKKPSRQNPKLGALYL